MAPAMDAPERDDFLSGTSGAIWGIRATSRALVRDGRDDTIAVLTALPWRLRRAAARWPRRRVLALGIERENQPSILTEAFDELSRSRHEIEVAGATAQGRGKWENIDALLQSHPAAGHDWLLVVDDDVRLPGGFLDAFVFLAERFELRIVQPAHRARSHAAWAVTRRRPGSVARETMFVESGPVVGFQRDTFEVLVPFPPLRAGWGLDLHWSALARQRGWKLGVLDAVPVTHGLRRIAAAYDKSEAIEEGRRFLAGKPYVRAADAQRSLVTHRSWG